MLILENDMFPNLVANRHDVMPHTDFSESREIVMAPH